MSTGVDADGEPTLLRHSASRAVRLVGLAEPWLYTALIPLAGLCAAAEEQEADEEQAAADLT